MAAEPLGRVAGTPLALNHGVLAVRLQLAHADQGGADILVTDLAMPGVDGLGVIRDAQQRRPGLPAVLLTGYAGDDAALAMGGSIIGAFSLLRKPVRIQDLVERIQVMLAAGGERPRQ
jgi:CheY-like chemotaxis protein